MANWNHTKIIDHTHLDGPPILSYAGLPHDVESISVISKDGAEMAAIVTRLKTDHRFQVGSDRTEFGWHIVDLTRTDNKTSADMTARIRACLQRWRIDRP